MNYNEKIITRFAPSPTGFIHLGNIRTALFNWLYAKKKNGIFLIRIDDTDDKRNSKIYIDNIFYILNWLKIESEKKIIYQSKNYIMYKNIIDKLINENKAYKCYCSKERLLKIKTQNLNNKKKLEYDRFCKNNNQKNKSENFVIRFFNNYDDIIEFDDLIKGKIKISNLEIDDFIIAKNNFIPTYNFASVIDDINYEISDIIRGEDHISNTPKQINIMRALNAKIPRFAHLPMILDEDKNKLSKRNKNSNVMYYKKEGFLPEAIINYIIKLGWSYNDKEIFSINEMINFFDIKKINSSTSIINNKKLIWLNKYYIKNSKITYIKKNLMDIEKHYNLNYSWGPNINELIIFSINRIDNLKEIITKNLYLYTNNIKIDKNLIKKYFNSLIIDIINLIYIEFKNLSFIWNENNIKNFITNLININKIELITLAIPLRITITGNDDPKPIFNLIFISGRILTLRKFINIIKLWYYK